MRALLRPRWKIWRRSCWSGDGSLFALQAGKGGLQGRRPRRRIVEHLRLLVLSRNRKNRCGLHWVHSFSPPEGNWRLGVQHKVSYEE